MNSQTMTIEQQEKAWQEKLDKIGTMPPCPMCQKPRVQGWGAE